MNAVAATGLVVRFDTLTAVDDVSLEIERGEVFGLLGPERRGQDDDAAGAHDAAAADAGAAVVAGYDVARRCAGRAGLDRLRAAGARPPTAG